MVCFEPLLFRLWVHFCSILFTHFLSPAALLRKLQSTLKFKWCSEEKCCIVCHGLCRLTTKWSDEGRLKRKERVSLIWGRAHGLLSHVNIKAQWKQGCRAH
eukprot:1140104-Pelagomonas_calceolata.AAC.1